MSPLLKPNMAYEVVLGAVNSTYPKPSRMTCTLAAPASHAEAPPPVLVKSDPEADVLTMLVHTTGSSAHAVKVEKVRTHTANAVIQNHRVINTNLRFVSIVGGGPDFPRVR